MNALSVMQPQCLVFTLKIRQSRCVEGRRLQVEDLKCIVSITGITLHEHRQLVAGDWEELKTIKGRREALEQQCRCRKRQLGCAGSGGYGLQYFFP